MNVKIKNSDPVYTIGMVAKLFNLSVHTLRLYESQGLIIPYKTNTRRRLYSKADIDRINCIREMIEEKGLNLAGIKLTLSMIPCWELLPCSEKDRKTCDAFNRSAVPCWNVSFKSEKCRGLDCRTCKVYQQAASCRNIKEFIKKSTNEAV